MVHKRAEALQCAHHLGDISDDRFLVSVRNLSHKCIGDRIIDGEFHLLRIDKHNLQLVRMLLEEQRAYHGIQSDRLTLTSSTSHKEVRNLGKIDHKDLIGDGLTEGKRQFHLGVLEFSGVENGLH